MQFRRMKNRALAKMIAIFPMLSRAWINSYRLVEAEGIPWTPIRDPLGKTKVALVTTAGVHHVDQPPFDMGDPNGDPTFREISAERPLSSLMITHDYYDHSDADRDINVVFPIERLRELETEGRIGEMSEIHFGFMGHTLGVHVQTLMRVTAPEAALRLKRAGVGAVLLTPG